MAENSSSHRQPSPRPNVGNNLLVEGIIEEASDDNEVQSNQANDPVTPGMLPTNPAQSILPPGETPISWYVRSQGALNAVYTQLCAQTAPVTQSRRPGSRAHASQREESTYDDTSSYQRQHHEPHPRRRQSVHDRLGSQWDTHTDESDQTYRLSANTSVFNSITGSCKLLNSVFREENAAAVSAPKVADLLSSQVTFSALFTCWEHSA
ncbi:hypothetical protein HanIR_Chr05g0235901 [Helianthus annuus]|nr:hypothetical protein HanIR_Chr05g0235901 [Helianthus annuus]